jgi:hypothetical protein
MKAEEWCSVSFAEAMTAGFALEKRIVILPASLFENNVYFVHFPMVKTVFLPAPKISIN